MLSPTPNHPACKGGGGGSGTAEPAPERDANRQSWEKVNKGHAPCRRPAGAHPPLRPSPVHFHSLGACPPPDSPRNPGGGTAATPARAPGAGLRKLHTHLERVSPPLQKKLCLICAEPLSPRAEHAAPACSARAHPARRGGAERRRWPRKVSGTGPAAREPSAGSCAPAQPGSVPGRAAYQQNETRGHRKAESSGFCEPPPLAARPPPAPAPAAAPPSGRSPRGKLRPRRASARPPAPPRRPGALCRSH